MSRQRAKIWDLPLRLFHWALVLSVAFAWYSVEIAENMELHFYAGYTIISLLIFRLLWGFWGSDYSRFASWLPPIKDLKRYVAQFASNTNKHYPGHNPMGAISAIALVGLLLLQGTTGLFATDEYYFGPLYGYVSEDLAGVLTAIHHLTFTILKVLIGLHLAAALFYQFVRKQGIIGAMLNGYKSVQASETPKQKARAWLAIILLVIALGIAIAISLLAVEQEDPYYY